MKKIFKIISLVLAGVLCFAFSGCSKSSQAGGIRGVQKGENKNYTKNSDGYYQISPEVAHEMMVVESDYVILDVRTKSEYNDYHILNAVLLPDTEIIDRANEVLPDKSKKILVYCRSGRRSKNAAAELAAMGYSNVWEFGGIIDWPYDTVTVNE